MNKKALSTTVSVVLIISVIVASIGIITPSILRLINSTQLSPEYSCLDFQTSKELNIISSCYNPSLKETKVSLSRSKSSPEIETINFNFIFPSGHLETYQAGEGCEHCTILDPGSSKTYLFDNIKEKPESVTIDALGCNLAPLEIELC